LREEKTSHQNALRYFPTDWHETLSKGFSEELNTLAEYILYRFLNPRFYPLQRATHDAYSAKYRHRPPKYYDNDTKQFLGSQVAQHPEELITYVGNGAVFQNWARINYHAVFCHYDRGTNPPTFIPGIPMGLSSLVPRMHQEWWVTNGIDGSQLFQADDWGKKYNALGVTQYGQN